MIGIDTNVLLRLLTDDDATQAEAAAALLQEQGPASIRVANIVLAEIVWALRSSYRQEKPKIIQTLALLLGREELVFEGRNTVMTALNWYERGNADFTDYLIAASNAEANATPTLTFDQKAADHPAFAHIGPRDQ